MVRRIKNREEGFTRERSHSLPTDPLVGRHPNWGLDSPKALFLSRIFKDYLIFAETVRGSDYVKNHSTYFYTSSKLIPSYLNVKIMNSR